MEPGITIFGDRVDMAEDGTLSFPNGQPKRLKAFRESLKGWGVKLNECREAIAEHRAIIAEMEANEGQ